MVVPSVVVVVVPAVVVVVPSVVVVVPEVVVLVVVVGAAVVVVVLLVVVDVVVGAHGAASQLLYSMFEVTIANALPVDTESISKQSLPLNISLPVPVACNF